MAAVALAVAALLAAALIVREVMWRRVAAGLTTHLTDRSEEAREHARHTHVTQVVSGLAQELKSPLQGVLGNTELMLASGALHPASAADLRQIQEDAERAAGIVRNLLAFTETHALTRRWQDVNELVRRGAGAARVDAAGSRLHVTLALAERLPLIYVDGRQLEKVITTLLSRASGDMTTAQAPMTVTTALAGDGERVVILLDDRASDGDEAVWAGDLAACRQVVQAHGGALEVAPAGAAFRFHLELPVAAVGAAPAAT